jgi:hypothetical protein
MSAYREQDPLVALLQREHQRILDGVDGFVREGGASAISHARHILLALADAEAHVLYPAFTRVSLRPETQRLLDDSRDSRARQLAVLAVLARRRAPRLRKVAQAELAERLEHHVVQHGSLLIPVLASQLPRALHRSLGQAFLTRYDGSLARAHRAPEHTVASIA